MPNNDTLFIIGLIVFVVVQILAVVIIVSNIKKHSKKDDSNEITKVESAINSTSYMTNQALGSIKDDMNKQFMGFSDAMNQKFMAMMNDVAAKMNTLDNKVEDRLKAGFTDTNSTINGFKEKIAAIEKAQEHLKELSNQMVGLENILTNNQKRGAFGEFQLQQILFATFGEDNKLYQMQHTLTSKGKDGESLRPDAVIFMPKEKICIDSKFPLEAYNEYVNSTDRSNDDALIKKFKAEVKEKVDSIAKKYIIRNETAEYAIMFVPSDGVLALLHTKATDIVEYSQQRKVMIVSPSTIIPFVASLKIVKLDYERTQYAEEIQKQLNALDAEFRRFDERWEKLKGHIKNVYDDTDTLDKTVVKLTKGFDKVKEMDDDE